MIEYRLDTAPWQRDFLGVLKAAKNTRPILAACGREARNHLVKYYRRKDRTAANQLAPDRRQHYWLAVANSVSAPVTSPDRVVIDITHPTVGFRLRGGTISAKRTRNLTIPVSADAYGRRAAVLERELGVKLFPLRRTHDGKGQYTLAHRVGDRVVVDYVLKPYVVIPADPTALPPSEPLQAAVLDRARKVLDRQLNPEKPE